MMRKIISLLLISFFVFITTTGDFALAQDNKTIKSRSSQSIKLYFFYGATCPHCHKASIFLDKLKDKYPSLEIIAYEVFNNRENAQLLLQYFERYHQEKKVIVPAIFIGQKVIIGYLDDKTTGQKIEEAVLVEIGANHSGNVQDEIINYPIFGKINLSKLSLPVLTIVVGGLDGFNPCAMWILLFLIALLINTRSRKRIWLIGGTFIAVSGLVYFLLLTAWLNLFLAIGYVGLTRIIIGGLAIGVGIWQIRKFITYQPSVCEVAPVGSKWHQRLSERAKQTVSSAALPATIFGVIVLAVGVNLIEFFCSAGLPAVYTRILSLSHLSPLTYYLYLLFYTFIFMLDDMIVFGVAIITLRRIGLTDRYNRYTMLIGGLFILILGLLLIFKPDFLAFG